MTRLAAKTPGSGHVDVLDTGGSADDSKTVEWKREQLRILMRRTLTAEEAEPLVAAAMARRVDHHLLEQMLDRGCALHLALEILQ